LTIIDGPNLEQVRAKTANISDMLNSIVVERMNHTANLLGRRSNDSTEYVMLFVFRSSAKNNTDIMKILSGLSSRGKNDSTRSFPWVTGLIFSLSYKIQRMNWESLPNKPY